MVGIVGAAIVVSTGTLGPPLNDIARHPWFAVRKKGETEWRTYEVPSNGVERDPFRPLGAPAGLQPVDSLGLTPQTQMLTAYAMLRPLPGVTFSAWYADPVRGGGDFEPPTHTRYAATFFSKFWRVFRSGAFALRAEVAAESWSGGGPGGITVDTAGTSQLVLSGTTFVDYQVEMQIVGVTLFWHMRNGNAMKGGYVQGLPYPTIVQFYGARWSFRR